MAEENKTVNKQKIDINTYRFPSGQTIDEILKTQTSWATDQECLSNMIDSNWRAVDDFITDKEKELAKKFLIASNNPEVDLKLLALQSEVATQYLCQKHTNQELWEKARNDPKGMTRPFSKDVVNIENQINFSYELPSWIKEHIEEIPNNWFQKTPEQLQKEQEKEDIQTTVALNNIAKDIVIEPYSRKPEDIEAMKTFVANVSGINAENITNEQSQAFIDNLGITEEAYLTAKADGTFEYTNNNPYSPDIYKTSEPKEILSIIEDYANDHITGVAPDSEQMKDYEFIHSINESFIKVEESKIKEEIVQKVAGFQSFDEVKAQYPNAVDLSHSDKKKMSYKEVESYLKTIVNDVMVTSDGEKISISDDYNHIMRSSNYRNMIRREKNEIRTYAAELEKLIPNSEFQKEIINKDSVKVDVDKFRYYTVPVWIDNKAYNVLLECGQLKDETSINAARKGATEVNVSGSPAPKYIRKTGRLQVADISYLYNMKNRPLYKKNQELQAELDNAKKTIKEQDELLNGKGSVKVNGIERTFEHGLKHAFPEAVKRIDIENQRNKDLTAAYNELAKSKSNDISPISPSDDGNTYS